MAGEGLLMWGGQLRSGIKGASPEWRWEEGRGQHSRQAGTMQPRPEARATDSWPLWLVRGGGGRGRGSWGQIMLSLVGPVWSLSFTVGVIRSHFSGF